jgi:dTDP-4-amino-4,6-dideoxygalactose transaminase
MQVPILDLQTQFAELKGEIMTAVEAVLDSQMCCNGPACRELEANVAAYSGCKAGVSVASGTDALLVALMALDLQPGEEVICPPFTFFATAGVVWRVGAKPVFVDIEPETFNIDPAKIESAVTSKTRAIIPVHLFGQCASMEPILEIARKHELFVLEDCAQSIGARQNGKPAGSMGDAGALSFYPTKNLGAVGDAGMIVTQREDLVPLLESIRNHGQGETYYHHRVGGNFRMDSIQAAALGVKLRKLDEWSDARRRHAARYDQLLADVAEVRTPVIRPENVSIYNQYVLRAQDRDALRKHLGEQGVSSGVYYPLSLHQQPCFAALGYKEGDFPVSEQAAREVLALPVFPEMTEEQQDHVVASIKQFYARL